MSTAIQYDPATKTGIIEIGFRGTDTVMNANLDAANLMAPIGTYMLPQTGDSYLKPTMRYWRAHKCCASIPYASCCANVCQDICGVIGYPCCYMENDLFQVSLFLLFLTQHEIRGKACFDICFPSLRIHVVRARADNSPVSRRAHLHKQL